MDRLHARNTPNMIVILIIVVLNETWTKDILETHLTSYVLSHVMVYVFMLDMLDMFLVYSILL